MLSSATNFPEHPKHYSDLFKGISRIKLLSVNGSLEGRNQDAKTMGHKFLQAIYLQYFVRFRPRRL